MPDFKNGDVRIYYEIDGNGPEVVLVHGLAGDGGAKLEDIKNPAKTPRSKEEQFCGYSMGSSAGVFQLCES